MATCLVRRSKMRPHAADQAAMADRGDWAGSPVMLTLLWGAASSCDVACLAIEPRTASSSLDIHAQLDGRRLLSERAQVWPHSLSLHRALLCWHGSGSAGLHIRRAPAREPAMALPWPCDRARTGFSQPSDRGGRFSGTLYPACQRHSIRYT